MNHRQSLSVRSAIALIATAAIVGCDSSNQARGDTPDPIETFREPPVVASHNGVLQTTLTPALSIVGVAGRQARLMLYNGLYVPPTLRARPGDTIRIRFVNRLTEMTNLHTHGLSGVAKVAAPVTASVPPVTASVPPVWLNVPSPPC